MENSPVISVVIPAYNVEAYIERCVRSVLQCARFWEEKACETGEASHSTRETSLGEGWLEILIVNDGSTDRTGVLCEGLAEKNPCIRILTQENGGLSAARNTGMKEAVGSYLLFLDGDDELEPETLKTLYDTMEQEQLDALFFGAVEVEEATGQVSAEGAYNRPALTEKVLTGEELFCEMVNSRNYIGCAVLYMVKRALYTEHKLEFVPHLIHEDQVFTPQVLLSAGKAAYRNALFYRRYNRAGSIMQSVSHTSEAEHYWRVVKELKKFIETAQVQEETKRCFFLQMTGFLKTAMVHACRIEHPTEKQREHFREMVKMSRQKEFSVSGKYRRYLLAVRMESWPFLGKCVRRVMG